MIIVQFVKTADPDPNYLKEGKHTDYYELEFGKLTGYRNPNDDRVYVNYSRKRTMYVSDKKELNFVTGSVKWEKNY